MISNAKLRFQHPEICRPCSASWLPSPRPFLLLLISSPPLPICAQGSIDCAGPAITAPIGSACISACYYLPVSAISCPSYHPPPSEGDGSPFQLCVSKERPTHKCAEHTAATGALYEHEASRHTHIGLNRQAYADIRFFGFSDTMAAAADSWQDRLSKVAPI